MSKLETFLILGGDPGAYRAGPLAFQGAHQFVQEALSNDGPETLRVVHEIAASGRALSHDALLYTLALASSPQYANPETNAAALQALPRVARTGAHLCKYAAYVGNVRGWGRGLRSAVADWYTSKPVSELATQILKHRHRKGWSHRDLLRLSHPKPPSPDYNALFQWAVEGELGHLAPPNIASGDLRQIYAFEQLKKTSDEADMVRLIEDYRLTYDIIPSQCRKFAGVWEALLGSIPYMAMVRNLGHLTEAGLIAPQSATTALIVTRLVDRARIRRANVHPAALLSALSKYREGRWKASPIVVSALEEAMHLAFSNIESTNLRIVFGVDGNSTAGDARCLGLGHATAADAAALLAIEFARADSHLAALSTRLANSSAEVDPSISIDHARKNSLKVDAFVFFGNQLPLDSLEAYRSQTGVKAKLVVVSPGAVEFERAVPAYVMRVSGFDPSVPRAIRQFICQDEIAAAAS